MQELQIQQGDSVRIAILLPQEKMEDFMDLVCCIGKFTYKFSEGLIRREGITNMFFLDLRSRNTAALYGSEPLLVAIDYEDIGVKKINERDSLLILVNPGQVNLNNDSKTNMISATINISLEEQVITNNILKIQQGDSVRIAINTPAEKLDKLEDLACSIGRFTYSIKNQKLEQQSNIFYVNLTSSETNEIPGNQHILLSVDYSDIGVKNISATDSVVLLVERNKNTLNNGSVSNFSSGTINLELIENNEIVNVTIFEQFLNTNLVVSNYMKGDVGPMGPPGPKGEVTWSSTNW